MRRSVRGENRRLERSEERPRRSIARRREGAASAEESAEGDGSARKRALARPSEMDRWRRTNSAML